MSAFADRDAMWRRIPVIAGAAIPILAIGIYMLIEALSPPPVPAAAPPGGAHGAGSPQIVEMVERLAARLKENPDDAQGWTMLARSYAALERFEEAARAYAQAAQRMPGDAQLLADYADALAMAQGGKLDGEPERLIARALAVDPANVKALALAGTVAFGKKDYAAAVRHWEKLVQVAPVESELARRMAPSLGEARELAGGTGRANAPVQAAAPTPALSGTVSLKPGLESKVGPDDIVFVYARAAEGPRVPLAVLRKPARELPMTFTLDDRMAMAPDMKLSSFPTVIVSARISRSGAAQPQPGDLQGASGAVSNAARGLKVVIDTEIP